MTPVDVVKTRLQLEPKGSKLGMASMARSIVAAEGPAGLMTGFGPTAVGEIVLSARIAKTASKIDHLSYDVQAI